VIKQSLPQTDAPFAAVMMALDSVNHAASIPIAQRTQLDASKVHAPTTTSPQTYLTAALTLTSARLPRIAIKAVALRPNPGSIPTNFAHPQASALRITHAVAPLVGKVPTSICHIAFAHSISIARLATSVASKPVTKEGRNIPNPLASSTASATMACAAILKE